jgi:hypothetical protein
VDPRFHRAIAAIDAANAEDPNTITARGVTRPKELLHAELVTDYVSRLNPAAPEPLLLAARAHHIRRWRIPRRDYPEGRTGYLRWRRALHDFHAAEAARILEAESYDPATIARTRDIIRKIDLAGDSDVQTLEDALCLVFLETQYDALAAQLGDDKIVDVTRKTLRKMSAAGKRLALTLDYSARGRALLKKALDGGPS